MFNKILIANRGEIACRIIRSCEALGVKAVAVYSDADASSQHVLRANEAVYIGSNAAAESYLVGEKIIQAALDTGAEAIHPGYGFLSENPEFAEACDKAGVTFIGPSSTSMRAMALKGAAKDLMIDAGVPVVPGYQGDKQDDATLKAAADEMGYPVLIKAIAGGGGKGMRPVFAESEFIDALTAARREAKNAFGNDICLIEKLIEKPRHIEVQVFGDTHGDAVHLFERDCSLQRRHQKVIEEAPAPDMSDAMRKSMGDAAVKAAKAINYVGAGTIEFIVDVANGLENAPFYFMEMNTRLQVEHPVTEMITGTDLVAWQLAVAFGAPLPLKQNEITLNGHSMEVRLYAEDPSNDFLPAAGHIDVFNVPAIEHTRVESGVVSGDTVSIHYDPMIAKLVAWGADRDIAAARLTELLQETQLMGLPGNRSFLLRALTHPSFLAADLDTSFIARFEADLIPSGADTPVDRMLATLAIIATSDREAALDADISEEPDSPWNLVDSFTPNLPSTALYFYQDGEDVIEQRVRYAGEEIFIEEGGASFSAYIDDHDGLSISATIDGYALTYAAMMQAESVTLATGDKDSVIMRANTVFSADGDTEGSGSLTAPMPGKILDVLVNNGDEVTKGQSLIVLEAMKMEQTMTAPADGTVTDLSLTADDQVEAGQIILTITSSIQE